MTWSRFLLGSLRFHWRIHVAVALGVAAAAAVLTGALVVGDSVRSSLRRLALDRLGRIDELLVADHFFREELAGSVKVREAGASVPAILFPSGTLERPDDSGRRRAGGVMVIGSGDEFWKLGDPSILNVQPPGDGQIILNAPLAEELGAGVGDELILRLGKLQQVPAESPLGRKTERIESIPALAVSAIIPAESLGRFSLQPMQTAPRNAYVSLATLQSGLDAADEINAIFVAGRDPAASFQPRLADYGLALKHVRSTFGAEGSQTVVLDYFSLSSDRMMLDRETETQALAAFKGLQAQPVLTYLANMIEKVAPAGAEAAAANPSKGIPYSTITAIDPAPGGPLAGADGKPLPPLAEDEIALTSWAAEDQQAHVGDRIRVTWFEPETIHGQHREASAEFRVAAIVPLTEPSRGYTRRDPAVFTRQPTTANDPDLTPEVKGITDQASIQDWDAPFPFDYDRLRDQDDTYWEHYRTTPKAYVSLATGRRLWGSRFGQATSIRIPAAGGLSAAGIEQRFLAQLARDNEPLGMDFQPLKEQGLAASSGTTPFDVLFLLLSMFIIAAALMLVWLLFRLGIEQRAEEIGTLLALGWRRRQTTWLLLAEGCCVAAVGAAIGVAAGVGYAWLMLAGLRSWWIGAIASPFLTLDWTWHSLTIGFALGLVVSALTIWLSLRGLAHVAVRQLLAGQSGESSRSVKDRSASKVPLSWLIPAGLVAAAVALAVLATRLGGEAQAGAFLSSGALVLVAILIVISGRLRRAGNQEQASFAGGALATLAVRNAGRSVSRSIATIALMASAAFLIVAVSSFRLSPSEEGVGGFNLLAESSEPVIADLNSAAGRTDLFAGDVEVLAGTTILSLRLQPGDDASCRNLYQPTQPRVQGVPSSMVEYFDNPGVTRFGFAASAAASPDETANPWRLLDQPTPSGEPVPVILDKNTAMYSLQKYGGIGQELEFTYGDQPIKFKVVGLLNNSVLQGSLLLGEEDFTRLFPQISGYRSFLIRTPPDAEAKVASLLEDRLGDEGFDTSSAFARLTDLLAVQNTYISTFQSLGAIGLLLGTFGLAAVQLRSVFERRKELALLRAAGFRKLRLGEMVLLENLLLLLGGLASGTLAALVAVLPHMFTTGAQVPLVDLAVMLGLVVLVGIATGLIAVRATLRAPLVAALRGE